VIEKRMAKNVTSKHSKKKINDVIKFVCMIGKRKNADLLIQNIFAGQFQIKSIIIL